MGPNHSLKEKIMRMRLLLPISLTMLCGAVPPQGQPAEICLNAREYGEADGFRNFIYRGRVTFPGPETPYGLWVVAIDDGDEVWVQSAGVKGNDGRVTFGVHNGSNYPLKFVVVRVNNADEFKELRLRSRVKQALSPARRERLEYVSSFFACKFELDDIEGEPRSDCHCP
jgi:hypothetical protein